MLLWKESVCIFYMCDKTDTFLGSCHNKLDASKAGIDISPTTGEQARKVAAEILAASDAVKKKAKEIIDGK